MGHICWCTCILAPGKLSEENQVSKSKLGYPTNSKPAWAARESESNKNTQTSKWGKMSTMGIFIKHIEVLFEIILTVTQYFLPQPRFSSEC